MNISTGMAEINLGRAAGNSPVSSKSYIWPKYHDGKVHKVTNPAQNNKEQIYSKPSPVEKERLLGLMQRPEEEYNAYGRTDSRKPIIKPGSFFDALA